MVGRDSFFYGNPEDNGFQSSPESDPKQNLYNSTYRPSTMGQQYPYPFPKPEIYTPIDKTIPLDPRKTTISKTYTHYRRERERALSKLSVNSLVQRLINEEDRTQEAKLLLKTAISHLEAATERANRAEKAREVLEGEHRTMQTNQTIRGLKATEGVLNAQKETAKAQEELGLYKLQLQHAEREVQRAQTVVRTVEDEREDALRSAKKAKEFARKMNEEKLMLIAREEGRKEGFEEGMRQGHLLAITSDGVVPRRRISDRAHATPVGSGAAFIEEYEEDEDSSPIDRVQQDERSLRNDFNRPPDMNRSMHSRSRQHRTPRLRRASLDSTPRGRSTMSRSIPTHSQPQTPHRPPSTIPPSNASVVDETLRQELEAARRDRDAADAQRREIEQREQIRQWHERQEKAEREKEQKALFERERAKEAELDREREAIRAKDAERDREMETIRRRDRDREAERAKELEILKKEREEREQEREQDRKRERDREEARRRDLATAAQTAAATNLPYLPMPPPPIQVVVQAPPVPPPAQAPVIPPPPVGQPQGRPQSQQFQPSHRRRRSSPDTRSPSSSTTGISQLDIVTFPTGMSRREDRDRDLSDIPEVPSIRSQSRASEAQPTPPSWVSDPPVDYTTRGDINQWRYSSSSHSPSNTSTALSPLENTYLSPSFQPRGRGTERISSSDYRRASSGSSNSYNFTIQPPSRPASRPQEPDVERQGFLSPNHTPRALTPEPPAVIAPSEIYVVPPPGFVAFQSPNTGHANLNGSGSNPPNGNIYSNWGTPSSGSPNAKPVPLRTPGAPSSGSRRTDTPPSHIPYHPHQPPRPIYAPTPPAHVRPLGGASEPPVIPPPFLHMAPRQPGGGGATPGPYHRSLPGGQPISTPRSGALRRIPSDSTISSSGSYSRPNQNSYDSPWVDRESPPDPATQRNTLVNAASTAGALPIPPPSFSRHRY